MGRRNESSTADFILLGLFPECRHRNLLIYIALLIYFVAIAGNAVLVLLIWVDFRLHVPMYFLLSQLSLVDAILISTAVPKMVADFFSGRRNISRVACGAQMFLYLTLGDAERLLLTLTSYDRYVAVCHPLRYPVLVSPVSCVKMVVVTWSGCVLGSLVHTTYTMNIPVRGAGEIHQYFCELLIVLKLARRDTSTYDRVVIASGLTLLLTPSSLIVASYALIFLSVLRMASREGRKKAPATRSSHLAVVALYFGPAVFIYVRPDSFRSPEQNQALSVFPTILTPALNPLIYSLRNKEVLRTLNKVLGKCSVRQWRRNVLRLSRLPLGNGRTGSLP
ncbi:olfactory receptor 2AG2-like [Ornithorhynchus anatinus]|uniref:olfactory receptor 2AG2-like n=1 Tax=Ornithorhynchus anatinus TaxID=9258 RepID=UPI0010A8D922|nr:olfactory receptor 2AG2-like [Ornithorhynchus anatinus]